MRLASLLATLALHVVAAPAHAAPGFCRAGESDRVERLAPEDLLPRLGEAFGVAPDNLRGASYIRCVDGKLMGCMVGANLNCGTSNVSRRSAGGDAFCRQTPGADIVPLAATGHDTIYDWHCVGGHAVAGRIVAPVDPRGFMAGNWRPLR